MGQSTKIPPFLIPLEFLMIVFNLLVGYFFDMCTDFLASIFVFAYPYLWSSIAS